MRRSCLLLCLVLVLGVPSLAQIIHVPEDHPSIQSAIDAAQTGDTVLVAEGTYFENVDFKGKPITLASHYLMDSDTSHITRTIINGSKAKDPTRASVVSLRSGEDSTSVLCGFTITGGTGSYLKDVHIESWMRNWRNMCGGGVLMHFSGGKIINNIIEYNILRTDTIRGSYGGGIMANVYQGRSAVIRSNIIRHNQIRKRQGHGGGICLYGGDIIVEYNVIAHNSINVKKISSGGAIFFQNDSTSLGARQIIIRNNVIAWNEAISASDLSLGGGIGLCFGLVEDILGINHNLICENYASGIGGGIYSVSAQGLVNGNLIFDNQADMYGSTIATEYKQKLDLAYNHLWSGTIWLVSGQYLSKLHVKSEHGSTMYNFLEQSAPSATDRFSIDPGTGELSIGEREGMLSFSPLAVPQYTFAPPVVILDYRQTGSTENIKLDLAHDENFLNFKFSPLELVRTNDYQYIGSAYWFKYFLEGWDLDTSITGMDMTAQYRNLRPGRYTFWAARSSSRDRWDQDAAAMSFAIRIQPPWYRSLLAIISAVALILLLTLTIIQVRTFRLRKAKKDLEKEVARRTEELKEKNTQILEMEGLKTRFFIDVSHEIRTPLSLISGPLEQLTNQEFRDPRIIRWLSLIRHNSQRLVQLVNQLLDISRLDAGYMKLIIEESDPCAHIKLLAEGYLSLAESKDIEYIIHIPDINISACYDKEKLVKVITNLLSNAFKFTSAGGTVTFRLKVYDGCSTEDDPKIRLLVADTGTGIPREMKDKIFERFFRGEEEPSHFTDGSGIGLALTRELVKIMHGEIRFRSRVGVGTVFMVTIPTGSSHLQAGEYIMKEQDDRAYTDSSLPEKQKPGIVNSHLKKSNISILVVEDNKDLQAFLLENLAAEFNVRGAYDGEQGYRMATSELPDLIITDVMMPGQLDGMELCRKIKTSEQTSHIPVVILTAKSTGRDKITGFEHGADDYIIKPFSIDELLVRTRNLLMQRERLRKKYSNMIGMDWEEIQVTTLDEKFLKKILEAISENLSDFNFNVSTLQEKMSMSREHIFRKLKALTGESPSSLIRVMRLKAAAALLESGNENITQVAMQVGFSNPSYFSHCFKAQYGQSPSAFILRKQADYTP